MRKTAIPLILSIIVLFASCGDPNIYSHMGYDPAGRPLPVETVRAGKGEDFNLLSLISGYDGRIRIIYNGVAEDYDLLRSLSEEGRIRLVQTVDYLSRYGDLGSYLAGPLDDDTLDACKDTIAFAILIIDDIEGNVTTILDELEETGMDVAVVRQALDSLFEEFGALVRLDPETVEDLISIQLVEDTLVSCIEMLYIILLDIPDDIAEYTWNQFSSDGAWTTDDMLSSISRNAGRLVQTLLDAIADIDQVASKIPSFVSLDEIVDEVLQ